MAAYRSDPLPPASPSRPEALCEGAARPAVGASAACPSSVTRCAKEGHQDEEGGSGGLVGP